MQRTYRHYDADLFIFALRIWIPIMNAAQILKLLWAVRGYAFLSEILVGPAFNPNTNHPKNISKGYLIFYISFINIDDLNSIFFIWSDPVFSWWLDPFYITFPWIGSVNLDGRTNGRVVPVMKTIWKGKPMKTQDFLDFFLNKFLGRICKK